VDYQPVDRQLDILGTMPEDTATLHVCVQGAGEHDQGAGNGQGVFIGLPEGPLVVSLDALGEDGSVLASAGPASFAVDDDYQATPLEDDGELCRDDGQVVPADSPSQVLGFRIVEPR